MPALNLQIPTSPSGNLQVFLPVGKPLIIVGRNGTGKSALVHQINQQCRYLAAGKVRYMPGSRPSYFDSDSLSMTPNTRSQFEANSAGWDASPDTRVRPISGTSRNERAIYDLQSAEVQYRVQAANEIEIGGTASPAISRLQSKSSPLDRVNRLLEQANLPVRMTVEFAEIKAVRDGSVYSISKMSDGERTALIFIAEVISAQPDSVFLIDEPELHLHRSIVLPLLAALISERPDCTTIVSTHELALADDRPDSAIVLVRGCTWNGPTPAYWALELLENSAGIPDDLRTDLLGSRQIILFVEGKANSRDQPLYATLFPKVSVRHRSSCTDVRRAVVGLREVETLHHARAYGLIDNDGMAASFRESLLSEGVYALSVFTVESLYYSAEAMRAVATRQGVNLKSDPLSLLNDAKSKALNTLRQSGKLEHLAARVAERQMRDRLLTAMPDRETMIASGDEVLSIALPSPYPATLVRIQAMLHANDLDGIVAGFPVRETGILADIARGLRFIGDIDYEKAVLAAVSLDAELAEALRLKLGQLAHELI